MATKAVIKKEVAGTAGSNIIEKNKKEIPTVDKDAKKIKKPLKKSSVLEIDSLERSPVGAVKAHSSRDVRGSSGLANTGTIISYE